MSSIAILNVQEKTMKLLSQRWIKGLECFLRPLLFNIEDAYLNLRIGREDQVYQTNDLTF